MPDNFNFVSALIKELSSSVEKEGGSPYVAIGYLEAMLRDAAMRSPKTLASIKQHVSVRKSRGL
jgi:hypothetical protein